MTIERLEELKTIVCEIALTELDNETFVADHWDDGLAEINEIIDAEIERQSITNEKTEEAIKNFNRFLDYPEHYTDKWLSSCRLAIEALKAYRPTIVTDEEVQDALDWEIGNLDFIETAFEQSEFTHRNIKRKRITIEALKAYRPKEPCEWCENGFEGEINAKYSDRFYNSRLFILCPNCGRKL